MLEKGKEEQFGILLSLQNDICINKGGALMASHHSPTYIWHTEPSSIDLS